MKYLRSMNRNSFVINTSICEFVAVIKSSAVKTAKSTFPFEIRRKQSNL